jgi:hypothetical protein
MARHLHVVRDDRRQRQHRRDVEAGITRSVELVAAAVAGLAAPMLHASLPALPPRDVRGPSRRRPKLDVA